MLHFADNRSLNTKTQQRTTITTILCCQKCIINVNDGLSISPLVGYNCLSNICPRGDFARPISRGSSALPIVSETIDRCIISPTPNCRQQISILIPPFQKSRGYPPPVIQQQCYYWDTSGLQEVFTLRKVEYHQYMKDSLDIDYPRNEGKSIFS